MAIARLRRFDITVLRSKTDADSTQTTLSSARVDFYRQGATVSASVTVPPTTPTVANVYDLGSLTNGSVVTAGIGGPQLSVSGTPTSPTQVTIVNNTGADVRLYAGVRLILQTSRPNVYADPFGTSSLGNSVTADANGRATGYIEEDVSFTSRVPR
jgi:hypothetical protein